MTLSWALQVHLGHSDTVTRVHRQAFKDHSISCCVLLLLTNFPGTRPLKSGLPPLIQIAPEVSDPIALLR